MAESPRRTFFKNPGGISKPWRVGKREVSPGHFRVLILALGIAITCAVWATLFRQYSIHLNREFREDLEDVALHTLQHWTALSLAFDLQVLSDEEDGGRRAMERAKGLLLDSRVAPGGVAILRPGGAWECIGKCPPPGDLTAFSRTVPQFRHPLPFPKWPGKLVMVFPESSGMRLYVFFDALPRYPGFHGEGQFDLRIRDGGGKTLAVRESSDHPIDRFHPIQATRRFTFSNEVYEVVGYANPQWFSFLEFGMILVLMVGNIAALATLHHILRTLFHQRDLSLAMLDRLTGGTMIFQLPGEGFDFSPRLRGFLGLRSMDPLAKNWREHFFPADTGKVEGALHQFLSGGPAEQEMEVRILDPSGSPLWTRIHLTRMKQGRRGETTVWGAVMDLRESRRQQEEIAASRERFRSLFEESREAILVLDEGGLLGANPRALELFGIRNPDDIRNAPLSRLVPVHQEDGSLSAKVLQALTDRALRGGHADLSLLAQTMDGRTFMAEMTVAAFTWSGRRALQAVVRDISARHMLEETNRRLKAALDVSALISVVNLDGELLEVNDEFCRVHGFTREELMGKNYRLLASGHHPPAFWTALRELLVSGRPWRGDVVNRCRDGRLVHLQTTIQPMPQKDGSLRFLTVRFDVTARVAQEERLKTDLARRTQDLQRAWHIQTSLNTGLIPPVPHLIAAAHIQPSETIGGDFLRLHGAGGSLFVILADCTGHGIGAAMEATLLAAMVDVAMPRLVSEGPSAFLEELNRRIMPYLPEAHYPTVLAARIEPRRLTWASGGAEPPFCIRSGGSSTLLNRPVGLNLGLDPEATFGEQTMDLAKGDRLLFYSDAWIEVDPLLVPRSRRLAEVEPMLGDLPPETQAAMGTLQDEFGRTLGSNALRDDLTLVLVDLADNPEPKPVPVNLVTLGDPW